MKKSVVAVFAALAVLVVALGGGAAWYFLRGNDPLKQARLLMQKGDVRGAQIELRNAVRKSPDSPEAHLRLGQLQLQLGDPVAGEKELKAARDLGADRWVVTAQLGEAYVAQGRYKDVLAEVPAEGPTPEIAAGNLRLRSVAQVAMNDIAGAKATLAQAETAAPNDVGVLLTASRLAMAVRDLPGAEAKVDTVLKLEPNQVDALLLKAQVLVAKGEREQALLLEDRAVELAPAAAGPRLDRASQLLLTGNDRKAQADVDAVLKTQPRNAGAVYLNAVLMVRAGRFAEAGPELQKLGPLAARFPRAMYFQALVAANLGQTESALDNANRYVAKAPGDVDGVFLLARMQMLAQRPEQAVATLTKAVAAGQNDAQTLDLLGRAYAAAGKTPDAVQTLKKASELAPNDAQILTHLATSQMRQGDPARAEQSLERSVQLSPGQSNAEALVVAALSAGDIDKADAALARLRAQAGETEMVGILTGLVRLGRLDLDGGRAAFADTLKRWPNALNARLNLAKVMALQGDKAGAETLLAETLASHPADIPALSTYVQMAVSESHYPAAIQAVEAARKASLGNPAFAAMESDLLVRSGDPARALAMLKTERDTAALPPVLLSAMARAQVAAGQIAEAKRTYADLLTANPGDLEARRAQVELLARNNEPGAAQASLAEALARSPGNLGLMTSIVMLAGQANGPDAALKRAADLRNDSTNLPNAALLKGDTLMRAGKPADAAVAYQEEAKITPSAPLALRLGSAYSAAGKDDDAIRVLRAGMLTNPEDADLVQMLGLIDLRQKRYADAETNLDAVLAKRPSDTVALNNLAWLYQRKNDPRARTLAQRAYMQAPTPETGDTLGWIMVGEGDTKGALPLLQQAVAQRPKDPAINYHLAVALKASGQPDAATKLLQPIVSSADEFEEKAAARKLLTELTAKK